MSHSHPSRSRFIGAILLITGNCIGAGMLALPVLTGPAGFFPSMVIFVLCWLFMATTGLLLLEVNLSMGHEVSIVSMASHTLGKAGKAVSWFVYLFIFYCLLVAYVSASGQLLTGVLSYLTAIEIPTSVGSTLFVILFGFLIYLGTGAVDHFNRWLMVGLVVTFVLLIGIGSSHVKSDFLMHREWSVSFLMVPVLIISFGFHNIIPSLTTYLKGQQQLLKWIVYLGSSVPLLVYLIWEWLVLGVVPLKGEAGLCEALASGDSSIGSLKAALGSSWIGVVAEYFAFFALVTSFLAVALSFVDFMADGLKIKKNRKGKIFLCALVLLPPYILALTYPGLFLKALNYAGGIGTVILFGIMPALMVWVNRYYFKATSHTLVRGGKSTLSIVILVAVAILILQVSQELGLIDLTSCWRDNV